MTPEQWERFEQKFCPEAITGCWLWWGANDGKAGYGRCGPGYGPTRQAHRLSYIHFKGPIPDGLELDHLCGNPPCVNPDHLEPVTLRENVQRAKAKRLRCRNGHVRTSENTYFWKRKYLCKICALSANRASYHRHRDRNIQRRKELKAIKGASING